MADQMNSERLAQPQRGMLRQLLDMATGLIARVWFSGSSRYWDTRYRLQGSSGKGSYGASARFKADFINAFVTEHAIASAVEFGCGDGAQLALFEIPTYRGVDVSPVAVERCRKRFATDQGKAFMQLSEYSGQTADLALSLDVVFHLVEDDVFHTYMDRLFDAAERFVVIYATDQDRAGALASAHVRHRHVSKYCATRFVGWRLIAQSASPPDSGPDGPRFLVYTRRQPSQ